MKKLIISLSLLSLWACNPENIETSEEGELITHVNLEFTDINGKITTAKYADLDGDGGNAPVIDAITLKPNAEYLLKISLQDQSKIPATDIGAEIISEGDQHLMFWETTAFTYDYLDKDAIGLPIGLSMKIKTGNIGESHSSLVLKHQPYLNGKVQKTGSKDLGTEDIRIPFHVKIQ